MRYALACLLVALGTVACDSSPESEAGRSAPPSASESPAPTRRPVHSPEPGMPYEGDWTLVSGTSPVGPIPIDPDYAITLVLTERQAGGRATCNGYGGGFKIDGTAFHAEGFGADQAGCATEELDEAETRYFAALVEIDEIHADETTLHLTGPGSELVFERLPEPDLDAVVDRTWVSGDHTLLLSSDRTFRISYGCDVLKGTWDVMAGRIYMPEARRVADCPREPRTQVDLDVSSGDFSVSVEGDSLTISHGGKEVVYRAER